jgi:hypothetical protein
MTTPNLAEQVATHMTHHFPTDTHLGGWEVARDTTDHTAVVIWHPHGTRLTTPAIRGQLLTRWLDHLQTIGGFTGQPRTDRSIFTDHQQPDGYACWLHITGRHEQPATA